MDTISLREFQLHAGNYLDKLPVWLTRYGKVVCSVQPNTMVYGRGQTPKLTETFAESVNRQVKEEVKTLSTGFCENHFEKGTTYHLVKISLEDETGAKLWTKNVCPKCLDSLKKKTNQYGGKVIYE